MANPSSIQDLEGFRKPSRSQRCRIGHTARAQLTIRECVGQVLAVVSNVTYLQTNGGEIVWLARDGVPMHARGVICAYDENALRVGMNFLARDAVLLIGERATIDLRDAREWQPRTIAPSNVTSHEVVSARLSVIARHGFRAEAIPNERFGDCLDSNPSTPASTISASAQERLLAMTAACRELIGLGAGLTPAGDDFVGGALFAAHHLREAYALTWDTQPIDDLLDWSRTQTNVISYTILRDLARGQGPEPLHNLLFALLARDATEDAAECAARLARIGSSTGTEMLAGALTGIRLITSKAEG